MELLRCSEETEDATSGHLLYSVGVYIILDLLYNILLMKSPPLVSFLIHSAKVYHQLQLFLMVPIYLICTRL